MRYNQIRECDIANGEGIGIALFVQGCPHHCKNCFNPETWDFNGGKEWTKEIKDEFLKLVNRPYIKRVTLLGGSPLAKENLIDVLSLVKEIKTKFPDKTIWLYTGYDFNNIMHWTEEQYEIDVHNNFRLTNIEYLRQQIVSMCDVVIDGRFEEDKKDLSLRFRGSSNQRIIDVQKSLKEGDIILWQQHTN